MIDNLPPLVIACQGPPLCPWSYTPVEAIQLKCIWCKRITIMPNSADDYVQEPGHG